MGEMLKRSHEMREDKSRHYNCAQAVFTPFAEKKGLAADQANAIAEHFGSGMRTGGTCGTITGGLMVTPNRGNFCGTQNPGRSYFGRACRGFCLCGFQCALGFVRLGNHIYDVAVADLHRLSGVLAPFHILLMHHDLPDEQP